MPKVVYTAAKGLVQEAGSGFDVSTTGVAGGGLIAGFIPTGANVAPLTGGGVIPLTNYMTFIGSGAGGYTFASGTVIGQLKKILSTDGQDKNVTITPNTALAPSTDVIAFTEVGDTAELMWNGSVWKILALYNMAVGGVGSPLVA